MKTKANKPAKSNIAKMAIVGVLSAIAYLLMFMEFSVPLMPVFIKMDLSDFPALIGSLAVGPAGGIIIALIKNLLHLTVTSTGGVGELSNFILNAVFILPAGLLYKKKKSKKSACGGAVLGAILMLWSVWYRTILSFIRYIITSCRQTRSWPLIRQSFRE